MKINKIHVILHRWGITTKAYKRYVEEMQRELDFAHLSGLEFWDKYYFDHDYK